MTYLSRPATLHVHAGHRAGPHRTDSDDFVHWWLPSLGPSSTLLARILAGSVTDTGASNVAADELAALLGLSTMHQMLWRSLDRLAHWRALTFVSTDTITMRVAMPTLSARQLATHPHADRYEHARAVRA